jgi:hypothetical protein
VLTYLLVPTLVLLPTWLTRAATDGRPEPGHVERWRYSYVVSVLLLIVFAGARANVGTDYDFYQSVFHKAEPLYSGAFLQDSSQEWGFSISLLGLRLLSGDPRILFMVSSVVTVGCAALAIRRLSVNFALSLTLFILLGFYIAPFNILRQGLAISLNFLAYTYLDKHRGRWLVLNVLAQLMHSSAIIAVVLQLALRRLKPSWRLFALMLAVSALIAVFLATLASSLGFLDVLNARYLSYLQNQRAGFGTYLYLASRAALVAVLLAYRPKSGAIDRYIVLAMTGVCLLVVGTQAQVISRLELYFSIYLVVALPAMWRELPSRPRLLVGAAVGISALAFYVAYLSQFGDLVPYHFDWSLVGLPGQADAR